MEASKTRIRVRSPAKLNLYLEITGRRPDGYHDLCMLNTGIDLADEIEVELSGDRIEISCDREGVPLGKDNLCHRAAEVFFEAYPEARTGASIGIKKRIPVAGGLGGGSSNAAAALFALSRLTATPVSQEELIRLGARVGADVPFFLFRSPAWVSGKGEVLTDAPPLPDYVFLVAGFSFGVSTAWAYSSWDLTRQGKKDNLKGLGGREKLPIPATWRNDLEDMVISKYSEVEKAKKALLNTGAIGAMMTGSGFIVMRLKRRPQRRN
jgi:4-diphosphocytidyl-2-C-methyl-D-erythritol kinase